MYLDQENSNLIEIIKKSSIEELNILSGEIRDLIIKSVAKNGGHLSSNLGSVELTIALHKVFDSPTDKIIFDVGHQAYTHKIITGRAKQFDTLRCLNGVSGFPKRSESEHDMYDSGHSGTSISAAFGYAKARDLKQEKYNCIAVIGDGALTGGVAYEALNAVGDSNTPLIVVLNDNQMSINKSQGGMARHLNKLRASAGYQKFKKNLKTKVEPHPHLYSKLQSLRNVIKYAILPSGIFEELGFKYFGPIDGHNISEIIENLNLAKSLNRPVVVHIATQKGKGFEPAEINPAKFHGIGSFDPDTVDASTDENHKSYSDIFGKALNKLAEKDPSICAVSAAMIEATGLGYMKQNYPDRVFDAGIAEQHAVSFAAGLALNGMKPVVAIYSTFLQRAYDQIASEVALQNLHVIFAVDRAGISGKDGETHQGMFDIAYLNSLPNMTILAPKDGTELTEMLEYALTLNSPVAIRYPRENAFECTDYINDTNKINEAQLLNMSYSENIIIAVGSMVKEVMLAKDKLPSCKIFNLRQIKPLQTNFLDSLEYAEHILIVEDGCLNGGIGQSIVQYLAEHENDAKVKCLAWPDKYIEHGSISELRHRYNLDSEGIIKICEEFFEE